MGAPRQWAEETHQAARAMVANLPAIRIVDDGHYAKTLPTLDRRLGPAGLRLALFLTTRKASISVRRIKSAPVIGGRTIRADGAIRPG